MKILFNACIDSHPWDKKYKTTLDKISERDYHGRNYIKNDNIHSLDPDKWEIDNSINNDSTMDAVIGFCDYDGLNYHQQYLALVELRLDYQSAGNLSFNSLLNKVIHTISIAKDSKCRFQSEIYFVFTNRVCPQAKNKFFLWGREGKNCKNWISITPKELEELIKTEEDVPYHPITKYEEVYFSIFNAKSYDELYESLDFWLKKVDYFKIIYNIPEASYICSIVIEISHKFLDEKEFEFNKDSEEFITELITLFEKNKKGIIAEGE